MEIRSIKNLVNRVESIEYNQGKRSEAIGTKEKKAKDTLDLNDWQKSVVEIAINYLENKNQVDNNHPLSQGRFKQIQSLEEALKELDEIRKEKFKEEGLKAQANIKPEDVLQLFVQ